MPFKIVVEESFSAEEVAHVLAGVNDEELFELIKIIDDEVADLDFSVKLRDHFTQVVADCNAEMPPDEQR